MAIRTQLLASSNLVPTPVVKPLFDPNNPLDWPSRKGRDWSTCTSQEIFDDLNAFFMYGLPGQPVGGLL